MNNGRNSRQSFLGERSEEQLAQCVVGVVGLGGGGSHIVQQLAHVGFKRFVLYDHDKFEDTNLNRLIGAKVVDGQAETPKLHIAKMMIWGLQPDADIQGFPCRWQEEPAALRSCHIIFGCVDNYLARHELEVLSRRYMVNYIDIGMDIHGEKPPVISGQVILSMPGDLCMRCLGFLTDEKLGEEGRRYGAAGGRPQVVWPNGVLASTAVGLAVDLVTDWSGSLRSYRYLSYDGNRGTVKPHWSLANLEGVVCPHYPVDAVGDPVLVRRA